MKVVTNNKMSETMSTERSSVLKKNRSMSAPVRGKENRLEEWESEVILKYIQVYMPVDFVTEIIRIVTIEVIHGNLFLSDTYHIRSTFL